MDENVVVEKRVCRKCSTHKPLEDFGKSPSCKNGRRHTCIQCVNASAVERRRRSVGRAFVYEVVGPDAVYVGKARNPDRRWRDHLADATRSYRKTYGTYFYRSIRSHGADSFSFSVVCSCVNDADALACEMAIILQHKNDAQALYNLTDGGDGPRLPTSQDTIDKLRIAGLKRVFTAERNLKISIAKLGKKFTPEHCAAISAAKVGINKGVPKSAEHRAKIGAAHKGRPKNPDFMAKLTAAAALVNKGRKISAEVRARMSAAQKGISKRRGLPKIPHPILPL